MENGMETFQTRNTGHILDCAELLMEFYSAQRAEPLPLDKLQILLYLAQKQCFADCGYALFSETMIGQPDGPYSPEVDAAYSESGISGARYKNPDFTQIWEQEKADPAFSNALFYGKFIPEIFGDWTLTELQLLVQQDQSWRNSRYKLFPRQEGDRILLFSDIQKDSLRIPRIPVSSSE